MSFSQAFKNFFMYALRGESQTYDDHNYYTSSGLRSYIVGKIGNRYSQLSKPLSQYTIAQVRAFQARPRDGAGQLWAVGRYQIIPATLTGIYKKAGLNDSDLFNEENQDKMAYQLLMERPNLRKYLQGDVQDSPDTLKAAALEVAKIWASIGVPYPLQGSHQFVNTNQSYYAGGGDVATVPTDIIQTSLRALRKAISMPVIAFGGGGLALALLLFFF